MVRSKNDTRVKKSWFKRVATRRNGLAFIFVVIAFIALNKYRMNSPIEVGAIVQNFSFKNIDGEQFSLSDINMPTIVVFYKKGTFFSNYLFNSYYKKLLPELKYLQDNDIAYVVVIVDGCDSVEKLNDIAKDKHEILKKIAYVPDDKNIATYFGVRSYPHLFLLDRDKEVIFNAKLVSADYLRQKLWR